MFSLYGCLYLVWKGILYSITIENCMTKVCFVSFFFYSRPQQEIQLKCNCVPKFTRIYLRKQIIRKNNSYKYIKYYITKSFTSKYFLDFSETYMQIHKHVKNVQFLFPTQQKRTKNAKIVVLLEKRGKTKTYII